MRSFYARTGRNIRVALGKVGKLTADEARERCQKALGNLAHGRAPAHGLDGTVGVTLAQFIEDSYRPWLMANRPKGAKRTLQRIATCFGEWYSKPLTDITVEVIERWSTHRLRPRTMVIAWLSRGFSLPDARQPSNHAVDRFDLPIDLVADTAPHNQGDVLIELGVLEFQGSANGKRSGHDELQAQTDGGKNPRRRLGRHRAGLGAMRD